MAELKEILLEIIVPWLIGMALLVGMICLPLAWFDGHAKSAYMKQVQGVDIPWYQATFLEVQINSVNAKVEQKSP